MKSYLTTGLLACAIVLIVDSSAIAYAEESAEAPADLSARVQKLEDRGAIRDLLVTYGRMLDDKDLTGYSNLFAENGVWEGGIGSAEGPEGIRRMLTTVYARVAPDQYGNDYHIMSDFLISVDGDTATAWSRWTWIVEGEEGKPVAQRSGHYEDRLMKVDGEWKFKYRLTVTELPTPENDAEAQIFRKDHRDGS